MIMPTIHLNGTSRDELHAANMNALNALDVALDALRKTGPNGRDYYPQGDAAIIQAGREHAARVQALQSVHDEIEALALHTMPTR